MDRPFEIENDFLVMRIPLPHRQVLPFFPVLDSTKPASGTCLDYRDPRNAVGHQQRALLTFYSILAFVESGGGIGLDLGGAGVAHPACLSLDLCGGGMTHPVYGGQYTGVHVKGDAADLSMFLDGSFSCVIGNHIMEHLTCQRLHGNETPEQKISIACSGGEIADILVNHWLRVLRPSGYFVMIVPDNGPAQEAGSDVFYQDVSHQHSWRADDFWQNVIKPVLNYIEVISFDTLKNNFSFELVARRR